ncbi:beta strand repeat-containing protein [Haloferula chungangensis]|uniref:Beta strand repeat-containing protein n=1 Tax=Haloferula chungangensis TaxID=1048331 RepID=A0ABW2LBZ0_9BACT
MKSTAAFTILSFSLAAATATAETTYIGPVFDLFDDSATSNSNKDNWTNGTPGLGNDGTIAINYDFSTLGAADNGNVNPLPSGAFSVTQTAGDGTGGQFNLAANSAFTFNLNGGSINSTSGAFIVNGNTFNLAGGTLNASEFRLGNGTMNMSSGSLTGGIISLRGGTFSQTGGTTTSNHVGPVFNQANNSTTLNLTGGSLIAGSGNNNSLIHHTNLVTTIGGSLTANLPDAVDIFTGGIHENSSTLNFTSDWTGSLTLNSLVAWDDVFEAGGISVDGVELAAGDFESYFLNDGGVITLSIAPQSTTPMWTGLGGSTWDLDSTANFSSNEPGDPLNNTTFDVATSVVNGVIFDDAYDFDGGSADVASFSVDVALGGIPDTKVTFTNDSNAYVVSSSDATGISGTTTVTTSGASSVTLLGTHAYTGATTIEAGTLILGNGTTNGSIADSAITNDSAMIVNNTGVITHNAVIDGNGSFEKSGAGTLLLAADYLNAGSVSLSDGELVFQGAPRASSYSIAASTLIELDSVGGFNIGAGFNTTFSGTGTLLNTGPGTVRWGEAKAVFELGSGALIDIQNGTFVGGSHGNVAGRAEDWSNNLADLNVGSGATFSGAEANIRVNVLTGSGIIQSGGNPEGTGYSEFTFGVDDGDGTFDGTLANNGSFQGNFAKEGSGTQTLTGFNTYTGNTTVKEGTLTLSNSGELVMAPTGNGVSSAIAGVPGGNGIMNLDGLLFLELGAADLTNGNSWLLVDDSNLDVNYGASFDINSSLGYFNEAGGVWTLVDGDNEWTFTEATGILSLVAPEKGFGVWLDLYPNLSDTSANGDPEMDGIENTLEYVLNGNPEVSDLSILPAVDTSGADFVFSFTRRVESADDTTQVFQYGSDLMGWTDLRITPPTASEVTLGTPAGGLQTVTVTISKSLAVDGTLFGRLNAVLND